MLVGDMSPPKIITYDDGYAFRWNGIARPYYLRGKGIRPEGVYVRQGASTVPATDVAILNMIKETSGDSYETARSLDQDLTFNKASDFFKKRNVEFEKPQTSPLCSTPI